MNKQFFLFWKFNEMYFGFYVNSIWENFWVELSVFLSDSKGKWQFKYI